MMHRFTLLLCATVLLATASSGSAGAEVTVPDVWKGIPENALSKGNGYVWFRCWIDIPENWSADKTEIFLEAVDDAREAYIDGVRVAGNGSFPPDYRSGLGEPERFPVPAELIGSKRRLTFAVRVFYESENRTGFNVAPPALFGGDRAIRLAGKWQMQLGDSLEFGKGSDQPDPPSASIFSDVRPAAEVARSLKKLPGELGPLSPQEALSHMKVPDDLEVQSVLSDPVIGQPLFMAFDERGRIWVVEYRQYPHPAGLKMVSRDKFLRAVYDQVPPPPPNHFPGADRISIHEDSDGDGQYEVHKTFVDQLSLCSSFAIGRGGVWVLTPPYLLFYPDQDRDDRPDGPPVVHLQGFGIEDSHSIANSLRWGPDGWLYGAQGSTVSADILRPGLDKQPAHSLGQLIWRYHPELHKYEVFSEGGGNTFGVEIDDQGRIFSGHNGGDTRGFHYVQGGYSQKGFGKHGPLSNPYAFGYFPPMVHPAVQRFTHNFVIYHGATLPESYTGRLFGVAPLQSHVILSEVQPDRSSFRTSDIGLALSTPDSWFRPVDIKVGPDGGVYVADFYEQRIDHASHYQGRVDKESGRIYRLQTKGAKPAPPFDHGKRSTSELVALLNHSNQWHRQTALRLLGDRQDASVVPAIQAKLDLARGQLALELLWAQHQSRALTDMETIHILDHSDPYVRLWAIRLACDDGEVSPTLATRLADLAYREPHLEVRSQLACSARRLPANAALAITSRLLARSEDGQDIHIPLLLWWSLEAKADTDREALLSLFRDAAFWGLPMVREQILPRVMKRYAIAGSRRDLSACAELLNNAPDKAAAQILMKGFEEAFQGRSLRDIPEELAKAIAQAGGASLALRLRQRDESAEQEALRLIENPQTDAIQLVPIIEILGQIQLPGSLAALTKLAVTPGNDRVQTAALSALQAYDEPSIANSILAAHAKMSLDVQTTAQVVLASRKAWVKVLLQAVASGDVPKDRISTGIVKKCLLHVDPQIEDLVRQQFGDVQGATTAEMQRQVVEYQQVIGTGSGNPYNGRQVYRANCAKCHRLFDDGGQIGPDLTAYKRDDLRRILLSVVNPSAEIREGFENHLVQTSDGRTLNGFIVEQDQQVVMLKGIDGQLTAISREDVEDLRPVGTSLMPEGLLKPLSHQQVRDLFAYLRSAQPLP